MGLARYQRVLDRSGAREAHSAGARRSAPAQKVGVMAVVKHSLSPQHAPHAQGQSGDHALTVRQQQSGLDLRWACSHVVGSCGSIDPRHPSFFP